MTDQLPAPKLPDFIAARMPFARHAYRLRRGADAGRHLGYVDHGSGRPVVLLHGNPTWSFLWRDVIAGLDGFRAIAPDLLGLGLSDKPPRIVDHSLVRHAEAITELVEALDVEDAILVGQDWGGPILASVGARLPERVAGIVMGNTTVVLPGRLRHGPFHRFAHTPVVSDIAFRVFSFPQRALHRGQGDPASIRGEVARAYRWPLRRWRDRIAPLALARMVPSEEDHPSVAELRRGEAWVDGFGGPIGLVWGLRDPVLGRSLKRHRRALPKARVWETQAGHFLQEEVPKVLVEAVRHVDRALKPS